MAEGKENRLVIDGKGAILGRLGTFVMKELLKGGSVDVINCDKVIISGRKDLVVKRIQAKQTMGRGASLKGPKYPKAPDRLMKRMLRGMLPRDRARGREAFKRFKCHIGGGYLSEDAIKNAKKFEHARPPRFSTMKEISEALK